MTGGEEHSSWKNSMCKGPGLEETIEFEVDDDNGNDLNIGFMNDGIMNRFSF